MLEAWQLLRAKLVVTILIAVTAAAPCEGVDCLSSWPPCLACSPVGGFRTRTALQTMIDVVWNTVHVAESGNSVRALVMVEGQGADGEVAPSTFHLKWNAQCLKAEIARGCVHIRLPIRIRLIASSRTTGRATTVVSATSARPAHRCCTPAIRARLNVQRHHKAATCYLEETCIYLAKDCRYNSIPHPDKSR